MTHAQRSERDTHSGRRRNSTGCPDCESRAETVRQVCDLSEPELQERLGRDRMLDLIDFCEGFGRKLRRSIGLDAGHAARARQDRSRPQLSPLERSVLACLAHGDRDEEIADMLECSPEQARVTIRSVLEKLCGIGGPGGGGTSTSGATVS